SATGPTETNGAMEGMMAYRIERVDGTTDGLGDAMTFATEAEAWEVAEDTFGGDPASDGPEGVRGWLRVVKCGNVTAGWYAVCNANGPISVALYWETEAEAVAAFRALDHRAMLDGARTDAEDDLGIDG